jgi:endonuclease VIII
MAEGHSVVRWATALRSLEKQELVAVKLPKRWEERKTRVIGHWITKIETRGKHLLLHLSSGWTLHTHAMMYGSWKFGRPGMQLPKPEKNVRLRLRTEQFEAVFFNGPVVEVLSPDELSAHPVLLALGPDVLAPIFDREEAWRRIQNAGIREIGEVLIDQTVVCGPGNIFKSESLFLAGIDPRRPAGTLTREEVELIWEKLVPLMKRASTSSGPITTLPSHFGNERDRTWVYARSSRPCFVCGTPIRMVRQGDLRRTTFSCAKCQT